MSYIITFTGKHFNPTNPALENIGIRDIAHALSLICRTNGHTRFFYACGNLNQSGNPVALFSPDAHNISILSRENTLFVTSTIPLLSI